MLQQGYIGALARQNTYSTTVYGVQEEGCSTSTVVRGVGVAPPRLIYKKKIDTCTWTPNSHKARQEDNVIGATSRQVHVILQYKPIVHDLAKAAHIFVLCRYLFCAVCTLELALSIAF